MTGIPQFGLSTHLNNGHAIVRVRGELDISTAPRLKDLLTELIDDGRTVITVDVSDLEFIDSNGIHALVTSFKRAQEQERKLELRSPRPSTHKVLEIVGLTEVIPIV